MKQTYIFSYHKFPNLEIVQFEQNWKFYIKYMGTKLCFVKSLIKLALYTSIWIDSYVIKKKRKNN